ncbi:hypothetical protein X766_33620 [Mesorhizobium sp. LSJC255A00]|nr:hypothetical protein X766_33620 [Mesorhizobium sp. LSJC255A00]
MRQHLLDKFPMQCTIIPIIQAHGTPLKVRVTADAALAQKAV